MRFWHVIAAIWTAFFGFLLMAATVPAGTAISNLASWAEIFHLFDLVPYLTKAWDVYTKSISYLALFMAFLYYSIQAYENRAAFKLSRHGKRRMIALGLMIAGVILFLSGVILYFTRPVDHGITSSTKTTTQEPPSIETVTAAKAKEEPKDAASVRIRWEPASLDSVVQVENSPRSGEPRVTLIKMYHATNISTEPLVRVRAYVTPQLNKTDLPMVFYDPHLDVSKKWSIKPGEEFYLYYDLRPSSAEKDGLSLQDYLNTYGGITITLEADSERVFQKSFAYSEIKQMLDAKLDEYLAKQRLR
jgi:hypothetical protein